MSVKGNSSSVTPADAIKEILETADSSVWTVETPDVFLWSDRRQKNRGPGHNQPAHLYVWKPTGASLERFSADGDLLIEEPTVETYIYTYDKQETATFARDLIQYFSEFLSDQYQNTEYGNIQPSAVEDFREQKITQKTDHFVYQVEVELDRETETGVA